MFKCQQQKPLLSSYNMFKPAKTAENKSLIEDTALILKCCGSLIVMLNNFSFPNIGEYSVHQSHQVGLILSQINPTFGIFVENHSRKCLSEVLF